MAIAFGSAALLMMLLLAGLQLWQQQNFLNDANERRGIALANGLARSSPSWVLANDLVGLDEIVQGYQDIPNMVRIFILSTQGEVLASTRTDEIGKFVNDPLSLGLLKDSPQLHTLVADENFVDVAAPILVNGRHVGWARVELNQNQTRAALRSLALTHLQFVTITTLLLVAIATWIGRRIGNRLQQLSTVSKLMADGDRSVRAIRVRNDEIGQLAVNLNHMLDCLARSEQDLNKLNRVYEAWTTCINVIAREREESILLNQLCKVLTTTMNLRLVFIGLIDEDNDWLKVIASSNWGLAYLKSLKVSARADRPEGQGPLGRAVRTGKPQIFNDFLAAAETAPWHAAARAEAICSVAAFPLLRGGKIVGGISVYSGELDFYNADMISLLNGLSADISFALDNIDREKRRQHVEGELRVAASVFENSQESIIITDANEVIINVNATFTKLTGYEPDEVIGRTPRILSSGTNDKAFYQRLWEQVERQGYWQGEILNRRKNGDIYPAWLCINRVIDEFGLISHYVGSFIDYTDHKLNEERIYRLAFYDPLTQLPNRRLLIERLQMALLESQRSRDYGALLFMDLDRFKMLNDSQGHNLGDQLLIEVSRRLRECVREQDTVARLGGDEFVIMLESVGSSEENAISIAQRIGNKVLDRLNIPYHLSHVDHYGTPMLVEHHSSASIGITLFQGSVLGHEELLKQADVAMYQAKQSGRNKLCAFNPQMQASINRRAELELQMRQALLSQQFVLYYQVQVNDANQIVGAEVLVRWPHPLHGVVLPSEFIPLAEETGMINELGWWILTESCKTLSQWATNPETRELTLAVNISPKQFSQQQFIERLVDLLGHCSFDPTRLKLEITENAVLDNIDDTIVRMRELTNFGVSFSMDDFGTGYSSLSYLQRLPLAQIKIDRSFVSGLEDKDNNAAIIRSILTMSQGLGMNVIAEGVETTKQREFLLANQCHFFQGYLFGKPEPLASFEAHLNQTASNRTQADHDH